MKTRKAKPGGLEKAPMRGREQGKGTFLVLLQTVRESKKGREESERHLGKMTCVPAAQGDACEAREAGLVLSPGISPSSPGAKPSLLTATSASWFAVRCRSPPSPLRFRGNLGTERENFIPPRPARPRTSTLSGLTHRQSPAAALGTSPRAQQEAAPQHHLHGQQLPSHRYQTDAHGATPGHVHAHPSPS